MGFASPVLFLHTYETGGARVVAEVEGHVVKVQIPLYWFGLLPAWSRYDSQRLHVLWGMVLRPCLLLVAVVHVLGLHFYESRIQRVFQFFSIREAEPRDRTYGSVPPFL